MLLNAANDSRFILSFIDRGPATAWTLFSPYKLTNELFDSIYKPPPDEDNGLIASKFWRPSKLIKVLFSIIFKYPSTLDKEPKLFKFCNELNTKS